MATVRTWVELRRGTYRDSVSLMEISRTVAAVPGVAAAQVAMATDLNVEVLVGMGFAVPEEAGPNDLVIAIRADGAEQLAAGLTAAQEALAGRRGGGGDGDGGGGGAGESRDASAPFGAQRLAPRTVGSAVRRSGANLAVVSVPGAHAVTEAYDALASGASVMVFSDNVPVEDEVRLKDAAAAADLLVMGPDCGTALVGGAGLGFANVVRPGPVGIVAASGTGAQQVMSLLDLAGVGVSHCLGVGGRDLDAAVGGRSARQALRALAADPATASVLVVSKPPDPDVLADLEADAAAFGLPVHWAVLGEGRPDLTAAVAAVLHAQGRAVPPWPHWAPVPGTDGILGAPASDSGERRFLRGLYCGGSLAHEAVLVTGPLLGPVRSNLGSAPDRVGRSDLRGPGPGHWVVDFGADEFTRGRAHPMIDPGLRLEQLVAQGSDPACGVLLLDLVLGHGAHPDPAGDLGEAIRAAGAAAASGGRALAVVVSLIGTDGDPQGLDRVAAVLAESGAWVFRSNAQAAQHAAGLLGADR
jgi:FdrA protein